MFKKFAGKESSKQPEVDLDLKLSEVQFIPISLKLPTQSEKDRVNILTEDGEILPDLAPLSLSGTKGRSGKINLPAVSDEEL